MPAFNYQAITAAGKTKKGVVQADSQRQVRLHLRTLGLTATSIDIVNKQKKSKVAKNKILGLWPRKIKAQELALMLRQISTLLGCGMPLDQALQAVAEQSESMRVQSLLYAVCSSIQEGHSFSAALSQFPKQIPGLYCATIAAGEASGSLNKILADLALYTEKQHKLKQKVQQALIYPLLMLLVSVAVVLFLLGHVVPIIISVFSDMHQQLPTVTLVLIDCSHAVKQYGWLIALLFVLFVFAWRYTYKKAAVRCYVQTKLIKLPVLGKTLLTLNAARFARTLGMLQSAGVPLVASLQSSSKTLSLLPMRQAVNSSTQEVLEGKSLHRSLQQSALFSPIFIHLLASGEMSGELSKLLLQAANYQEDEVEAVIQTCLTLFEPIMILVMGAVVLFIVLAILLPIFDLDQFAGQ